MSHTNAKRLTEARSIRQAQIDIDAFVIAHKGRNVEADWAIEEIDRIAGFYCNTVVDAYAARKKKQIANLELRRITAYNPAVILILFLLLPIFAPAQSNTYRDAMRLPPAKPPVAVAYRVQADTVQVQRKYKPVQPVAVLLPRKIRNQRSFFIPSFR